MCRSNREEPLEINEDLVDDYDDDYEDEYQDDFEDTVNSPNKQKVGQPGNNNVPGGHDGNNNYLGKANLGKLPKNHNKSGTKSIRSDGGTSLASNADRFIQKYSEKHPFKAMEKAVLDARKTLDRFKGSEDKIEQMEEEEQKKIYVDNQNKKLRKELKKMNDNLNKLIGKFIFCQSILMIQTT